MEIKTTVRVALPLALGAVVLAGCSSSGSSGSKNNSSGGNTFTIGYQGPLSGGNAQLGLNMKFAVELAITQANSGTSQFGKLPFKLAFTSEDDQGSPTVAPTATQKMLQTSNLIAVVGPAFSGATKASEPFYSQANVATVSPSATNPTLATSGWKNFFRVVADDNSQGPADANYIGKVLKKTKVYLIDDASAYAAGLATAFKSATSGAGISIVKSETVPGTTQCQAGTGNVQQYAGEATKIKGSGADVVMYAGYYCDLALLAKALRAGGYSGQIVSDDGSKDPKYVAQAGKSVAEGTVISCACQDNIAGSGYSDFATAFKALAGFAVGTYSAEAYDATNAIISALKGLGSKPTRSGLVDALHASGFSFQGIGKTVTFAADGNYGGGGVYIYQVKGGTITQLGEASQLAS